MTRTDITEDEPVRTDLDPPQTEWSKPIRVRATKRMFPIRYTLNPRCHTCGQPLPKPTAHR